MERGGAAAAAVCLMCLGVLVVVPTSLIKGEGLVVVLLCMVGMDLRCRDMGGGKEMRETTNQNQP